MHLIENFEKINIGKKKTSLNLIMIYTIFQEQILYELLNLVMIRFIHLCFLATIMP